MTSFRVLGLVAAAAVAVGASPSVAAAQSNDEIFPQFQWNFATPGARANAMGRAFIGLADDASAAITNPAGLLSLTRPQAYFEFKDTDVRVSRLSTFDSFTSLVPTTTSKMVASPAFFSFSAPVGKKLAVAFTRNEFLNYQENFQLGVRLVPGAASAGFSLFPVNGSSNFSAASYAGTIAYAVTPQIRVGLTVSLDRLSATSLATRFEFTCGGQPCTAANATEFTVGNPPANLVASQTSINSTSTAASMVVGALWLPTDKVSVGVQFSKGADLSVTENFQVNPGVTGFTNTSTNQPLVNVAGSPFTVPINVPNRFGFGAAFRPTSRLLATFDFVRIGYSSLANNFVVVFDSPAITGNQFSIPNVVEAHFGGEYLLRTNGTPIYLRAGVFTSPDHSTVFTPTTPAANVDFSASEVATYNLLPRKTTVAGTVGAGFVFGKHSQLDLAYVGTREFVVSLGARF
jgi:long-chain fatty acid transport protein